MLTAPTSFGPLEAEGLPDSGWTASFPIFDPAIPPPPSGLDSAPSGLDSGAMSNLGSAQSNVPPSRTSEETASGESRDGSTPRARNSVRRAGTIWRADHKRFDVKGGELTEPGGHGLLVKTVDTTSELATFFGLGTSWMQKVIKRNAELNQYPVFGLLPDPKVFGQESKLIWLMKSYSPTSNQQQDRDLTEADREITAIANESEKTEGHVVLKVNVKEVTAGRKGTMGIDRSLLWG